MDRESKFIVIILCVIALGVLFAISVVKKYDKIFFDGVEVRIEP